MARSSRTSPKHLGRTRKIETLQDFMESLHTKLHGKVTADATQNFNHATAVDRRYDVVRHIVEETMFYGS